MPGASNQRITLKRIPHQQPVVKGPNISVKKSEGQQVPHQALPITSAPRLPITLTDFTRPFILTEQNLKTFLEENPDESFPFRGRFVFDSKRELLAIGSQFLLHDQVAEEALPTMIKKEAVAAKIIFAGDRITLYGGSMTFGAPGAGKLEMVTEYLTGLLAEAGVKASYGIGEGPSGERAFVIIASQN